MNFIIKQCKLLKTSPYLDNTLIRQSIFSLQCFIQRRCYFLLCSDTAFFYESAQAVLRLRQPSRCQVKVSPLDTRLHRMATLSELSRPPKLSSRFKLSSQSKQTSRGSHPGSPTHSRLPSSRAPLRGAWEENIETKRRDGRSTSPGNSLSA